MSIPFHSIKTSKKRALDLHDILVSDEVATFFARVRGDEHADLGVYDGDILVIDRSRVEDAHRLYVVIAEGEFLIVPRQRMPVGCECWGAITYVIHKS